MTDAAGVVEITVTGDLTVRPGPNQMDGPSDEELMALIATGDRAAFQRLAARSLPFALRLARGFVRNDADAEDLAQEAMLRVWINAARWRPTAPFRAWLYRMVVNLSLNRLRRAPFSALDDVGDPADPGLDALAGLEAREEKHRIDEAIAALPERQRTAIVLTYQEGFSNSETAVVLDSTVSGVEALLARARQTLRKALKPSRDED